MENIKKSLKNIIFKISAPTWNEKFELHDGLYSVSDIEDYFIKNNIIKKHETVTDNTPIRLYILLEIEDKIKISLVIN